MKLNWKKICAVALAGVMTAGYVINVPVMDKVQAAENTPYITEIPGTVKTEKELDGSFLSVSGFAKGNVKDRSQYAEGDNEYAVVTDEMEFFEALEGAKAGEIKVIEIQADLKLGWNELSEEVKAYYGYDMVEPYAASEAEDTPVGNPVLIESGISTVTVDSVDGLTIFSTMGNSIKHAEIKFNSKVNDLVIRNLEFTEVWEWDDWRESGLGVTGGKGNRKRTGWTNIKLNGCNNVWIDHCTFGNSFDGNIDVENGSSGISITWCKIGDDDMSVGSVTYKTAMYLEELYQQNKLDSGVSSFVMYKIMRDNGLTVEQIMQYMSQHDKVHLGGAGDKDSWLYDKNSQSFLDEPNYNKTDANERIQLSLGYNSYSDIGQRLPMIRGGMGHVYNCYIDDWSLAEINSLLNSDPLGKGKTIREQISLAGGTCVTLARGMDARNGASIAADTCVYYGADTAITGTAYHPNGSNINAGFENTWAYNYALVVNSSFQKYGSDEVYKGSSWDNNGKNPFIENDSYWQIGSEKNDNAAAVIIDHWKWRQAGINTVEDGNETDLPYEYQTFPLEDVKANTEKYSGFRKVDMSAQDWLKTEYDSLFELKAVDTTVEIPIESIEMTKSEATLFVEEEFLQLEAEALPFNTTETEASYQWTSSNPDVATVNECGLVIPVTCGSVRISVTTEKGLTTYCDVNITHLPAKVDITNIPKTIYVGDTITLDAVVSPSAVIDDSVVWQNNGVNMQMIDAENGVFKAIKAGKNPIQATTVLKGNRVGSNTGAFIIKTLQIVEPDVYTTGVELEEKATVRPGETVQLNASVLPENATNKNVTWKVSDPAVATVDKNGLVTAVTEGAVTVTVTTINGGFEDTCEITVTDTTPVPPNPTGPAVDPDPGTGPGVDPDPGTGPAVDPNPVPNVMKGDVDGNKKVELADAQLALKIALKIIAEPTKDQIAAADVDGNKKVELSDAQKILKVALKIEQFE